MPSPDLTVYTIGQHSADDCRAVLASLRDQTVASQLEVLVVAPSLGDVAREEFDCFHRFDLVPFDPVEDCGTTGAAAVRAATAPFVTYAEEHAFFEANWAEELIAAHRRGYDVVGCAMKNANPRSATSWAHLYAQFGPVVHPTESRKSDFLAGHHVSYRRDLLLAYGGDLRTVLEDESALFLELRSRGVPLYIEGKAISYHVNLSTLSGFGTLEFVGMRSFASSRAELGKWPLWRRLAFAVAIPLVPCLRVARISRDMRRSGRLRMLPSILPSLLPALACGALGEATGYLFGPGRSAQLKTPIELQRHDFVAGKDR